MSLHRAIVICLSIAVISIGAGCSGESEGSSGSGTISKADFVARANAACREIRAELKKKIVEFERLAASEKPGATVNLAHAVWLPTVEEELAAIEALPEPEETRRRLAELLDVERREASDMAIHSQVATIARAEQHFRKAGRFFRGYGLDDCANGPEPPGGAS